MSASSKLFQPRQVGQLKLQHRIVHSPTTRFRADDQHRPFPRVVEYYSQRTRAPGSLIITEATYISPQSGGMDNVPGIYSDEQIASWKKVTDAVHANSSFIYLQIWGIGRVARPDILAKEGDYPYTAAGDIPHPDRPENIPRPLTVAEIQEYVQAFATAASNAVHRAGFDGVEIHGANGYLADQFLQDVSNNRTDEYGGSIENRARFGLEVLDAVVNAVGESKTGYRLNPWGHFGGMGMADPKPTFSYMATRIRDLYPKLAYLHLVEPRTDETFSFAEGASNDFLRDIWGDRPLISAGGYDRQSAIETAETKGDLIAFSRHYLANPDLVYRLQNNVPLTKGDRATYFVPNPEAEGYTDYPFATPTQLNKTTGPTVPSSL